MARRLRLQFPGALYHVINRGNYRGDVFADPGAAGAFMAALSEACDRHQWQLHAYALMRNHFHLALHTPEPNLVEGMHWLESTYATRFNRFRSEHGHLFQGRYQSLLIEDAAALARVVNYIHLNPVRAGIAPSERPESFRWSSLREFGDKARQRWLVAEPWLSHLGYTDTADGWREYADQLAAVGRKPADEDDEQALCCGWAIGTAGWRRAVAKDHAHLALDPGLGAEELRELKEARWTLVLDQALAESGNTLEQAKVAPKGAAWKRAIAERLRREAGAPHAWIAAMLHMGSSASVRVYLSRDRGINN